MINKILDFLFPKPKKGIDMVIDIINRSYRVYNTGEPDAVKDQLFYVGHNYVIYFEHGDEVCHFKAKGFDEPNVPLFVFQDPEEIAELRRVISEKLVGSSVS